MSHLPAFEALRASLEGEQRRLDVFAEEINSTLSFLADVYEKHIGDGEDCPETISSYLIGSSAIEGGYEEYPIQDKEELEAGTPVETTAAALADDQASDFTEYWPSELDVLGGHHCQVTTADVEPDDTMLKWRALQHSNVGNIMPAFSHTPCLFCRRKSSRTERQSASRKKRWHDMHFESMLESVVPLLRSSMLLCGSGKNAVRKGHSM